MAPRRRQNSNVGPSLPRELLEQLDASTVSGTRAGYKSSRARSSRREARKQNRVALKQRKAVFFASNTSTSIPGGILKRAAQTEHDHAPAKKKVRFSGPEFQASTRKKPPGLSSKATVPSRSVSPTSTDHKEPGQSNTSKVPKGSQSFTKKKSIIPKPAPSISSPRTQTEIEEDTYIAYLEARLGYKKSKGKSKAIDEDGLDDLLDLAESIQLPSLRDEERVVLEGLEHSQSEKDDSSYPDPGSGILPEEWHGIQDVQLDSDASSPAEDISQEAFKIAPAGSAATRYVPPQLRNRSDNEDENQSEAVIKLTKQLKGLLNRMSEQNISNILDSIEELYRNHGRHDVTSTLTKLIVDGIASHSSLLDSYVVLYAAFASSLHKIIGIDFAAYFVQNVIASYERFRGGLSSEDEPSLSEDRGKECSNLIVLISELYNFQVISCILVYDIIRDLLAKDLSEFDVELLLKVVRNSGQQLRQDDPSALKDIIQIVQTKVSQKDEAVSSRTKFMIETLVNLKNNKLKNSSQNGASDAVERMKKFLSSFGKKRQVMAHEPLRVTLEDLRSAGEKGKWWLVGAAWGGDPLVDRQQQLGKVVKNTGEDSRNELLLLARKQGMNTDIRRSIFVVLMSSDDYVDACERLGELNLTEVQQREIIRVALRCCGNEKSYNPYYTLVCHHLCKTSHSHKITLQFCLWDFLRDLGESKVGGMEVIKQSKDDYMDPKNVSVTRIKNVAKAYAWLIAKDSLTLSILKPVDFTVVKPQTKLFLEELFTMLFISSQGAAPLITDWSESSLTRNRGTLEEIFVKTSKIEGLAMGLVYFLSTEFQGLENLTPLSKFLKWACDVAIDTLRTGIDIIPTL